MNSKKLRDAFRSSLSSIALSQQQVIQVIGNLGEDVFSPIEAESIRNWIKRDLLEVGRQETTRGRPIRYGFLDLVELATFYKGTQLGLSLGVCERLASGAKPIAQSKLEGKSYDIDGCQIDSDFSAEQFLVAPHSRYAPIRAYSKKNTDQILNKHDSAVVVNVSRIIDHLAASLPKALGGDV